MPSIHGRRAVPVPLSVPPACHDGAHMSDFPQDPSRGPSQEASRVKSELAKVQRQLRRVLSAGESVRLDAEERALLRDSLRGVGWAVAVLERRLDGDRVTPPFVCDVSGKEWATYDDHAAHCIRH